MKELAFIDALLAASGGAADLPVGPGDDAAVLPGGLVVTVDTITEGHHFARDDDVDRVARKAVGVSASDCAAMGAAPWLVFFSAAVRAGVDAERLAGSLARWSTRFGLEVAGGDTVGSDALTLTSIVVGRLDGSAPWLRSGASPGDGLFVSGPLGGSLASGRHLDVAPRADAAAALRAAGAPVSACLDLSDGLALDLPRLARASGVGARVFAGDVPVHADVPADVDRLAAALGDGEDFELLVAAPLERAPDGWTRIGETTTERRLVLVRGDVEHDWPSGGFEHGL